MTNLNKTLIYALLIAILIGTALTYRHVTEQCQEVEARVEYLTEPFIGIEIRMVRLAKALEREVKRNKQFRKAVMEMFSEYWSETNGG